MENEHVIHALAKKYGDLSADIRRLQNELRAAQFALEHVKASLLLFDPDYPIPQIHVPNPNIPHKPIKERNRRALDILRTSQEPLTSRELAKRILAEKGNVTPDSRTLDHTASSIHVMLKRLYVRGKVLKVSDGPARWALVS